VAGMEAERAEKGVWFHAARRARKGFVKESGEGPMNAGINIAGFGDRRTQPRRAKGGKQKGDRPHVRAGPL
jgi:hypothetical protein